MKNIFACLTIVFSLTACSKKSVCEYDACAIKATTAEIATVENHLTTNAIVATKHCSGYYYIVDAAGSGNSPNICSYVSATYKGAFLNGIIFDQSATPVNFEVKKLIEGWKKALPQLKPGGRMRMWIPPSLAYGAVDQKNSAGVVVIPANSTLYFEMELKAVL